MAGEVGVAVIVLNWNGADDTIECLESLARLNHSSYCVIVVDNASSDESVQRIQSWAGAGKDGAPAFKRFIMTDEGDTFIVEDTLQPKDLVLLRATSNGGYAKGNNLGIRFAMRYGVGGVWILNNDTEVHPDALAAMEKILSSNSKVGIVGSVLLYYDDRLRIQAYGGASFDRYRARGSQIGNGLTFDGQTLASLAGVVPDYISGASALVSDRFIREVGVMEESYFLYYEEIDWAIRASRNWTLAVAPTSIVYHKEGGSIGTSTRSERSHLSQYFLNRNLVAFYRKFFPFLTFFSVVRILREIARCLVRKDFDRARVTVTALADGLRGITGPRL